MKPNKHSWVKAQRRGVSLYYCAVTPTVLGVGRQDADCAACQIHVTEKALELWTRFLPRELNAALDQIVDTRQQVAEEEEALT